MGEYQADKTQQNENDNSRMTNLTMAKTEKANFPQPIRSVARKNMPDVVACIKAKVEPSPLWIIRKRFRLLNSDRKISLLSQTEICHELCVPLP